MGRRPVGLRATDVDARQVQQVNLAVQASVVEPVKMPHGHAVELTPVVHMDLQAVGPRLKVLTQVNTKGRRGPQVGANELPIDEKAGLVVGRAHTQQGDRAQRVWLVLQRSGVPASALKVAPLGCLHRPAGGHGQSIAAVGVVVSWVRPVGGGRGFQLVPLLTQTLIEQVPREVPGSAQAGAGSIRQCDQAVCTNARCVVGIEVVLVMQMVKRVEGVLAHSVMVGSRGCRLA